MSVPDKFLYLAEGALMTPVVVCLWRQWRQWRRERRADAEFAAWFLQREAVRKARAGAAAIPRPVPAPDDDQAWLDYVGALINTEREP